jgi:hypothetical protein
MLLGRSIHLDIRESPELVLGRLSAAVLPVEAIAPVGPVRLSAWIAGHVGKRFVGRVDGPGFKLGLLPEAGTRFQVRGSVVVIVGKVEGGTARVTLRPPVFISVFLAAFASVMAGALALSFFGPLNGHMVQAALALALVLPSLIVVRFFRREATLAEHAIRQVLLGSGPDDPVG